MRNLSKPGRRWRAALAGITISLFVSGCATLDPNIAMTEQKVTPINAGETFSVSAYDIAEVMLRAGFSPEEILSYGHSLHLALAMAGGAQVRNGKLIQAVFAVHSGRLYVASRSRGTFIQPLGGGGDRIARS